MVVDVSPGEANRGQKVQDVAEHSQGLVCCLHVARVLRFSHQSDLEVCICTVKSGSRETRWAAVVSVWRGDEPG